MPERNFRPILDGMAVGALARVVIRPVVAGLAVRVVAVVKGRFAPIQIGVAPAAVAAIMLGIRERDG